MLKPLRFKVLNGIRTEEGIRIDLRSKLSPVTKGVFGRILACSWRNGLRG